MTYQEATSVFATLRYAPMVDAADYGDFGDFGDFGD